MKASRPSIIEIDNGIMIYIDVDGNVGILGHNKVKIITKTDLDIDALNINIKAHENVRINGQKVFINCDLEDENARNT